MTGPVFAGIEHSVERIFGTSSAWLILLASLLLLWHLSRGVRIVMKALNVIHDVHERPEARWASAGSALVVVTWLLMSLLFGWWALSIANYKTAAGTLLAFLFLTAYVLASSAIFLAGAQLDELARRESRKSNR